LHQYDKPCNPISANPLICSIYLSRSSCEMIRPL